MEKQGCRWSIVDGDEGYLILKKGRSWQASPNRTCCAERPGSYQLLEASSEPLGISDSVGSAKRPPSPETITLDVYRDKDTPENISFINYRGENNQIGFQFYGVRNGIVDNCYFEAKHKTTGVAARFSVADAAQDTNILVSNSVFRNPCSETACISITSYAQSGWMQGRLRQLDIRLSNCTFVAGASGCAPSLRLEAPSRATFSNCWFVNGVVQILPPLPRISGTVDKECDLRIEVASDGNTPEDVIRAFEREFETKKNECAVIIVRAGVDLEEWTVAGFDDAGAFCIFEIDDSNHELSQELLKKPVDEHRIVELATSCLGRCQAGTLPGYIPTELVCFTNCELDGGGRADIGYQLYTPTTIQGGQVRNIAPHIDGKSTSSCIRLEPGSEGSKILNTVLGSFQNEMGRYGIRFIRDVRDITVRDVSFYVELPFSHTNFTSIGWQVSGSYHGLSVDTCAD